MAPPSPTGIKTEAWIWIRAVQFLLTVVIFITGCIDTSHWAMVLALFFPLLQLNLLILLDSIIFYKKRYAHGAGRTSTLRWVTDFCVTLLLSAAIPVVAVVHSGDYSMSTVSIVTMVLQIVFVSINLCLFLSTFIMLCVEDARLRKRGKMLPQVATDAIPLDAEPAYVDSPVATSYGTVDAEIASDIMNRILSNGFTLQHLEKMGAAPPPRTPSVIVTSPTGPEFESRPPTYKA